MFHRRQDVQDSYNDYKSWSRRMSEYKISESKPLQVLTRAKVWWESMAEL